VKSYLLSPASDALVLYGLSGSGKTSVLAKSASLVHCWLDSLSPVVLVRFLGTLVVISAKWTRYYVMLFSVRPCVRVWALSI